MEIYSCFFLSCPGKKREGYLNEMERLRSGRPGKGEGPRGSLTISDIRLPLKKDFTQKIGTQAGESYYNKYIYFSETLLIQIIRGQLDMFLLEGFLVRGDWN